MFYLIPPTFPAEGVGQRKKTDTNYRKTEKKEQNNIFDKMLKNEIKKISGK